jgi:hypothetical protein
MRQLEPLSATKKGFSVVGNVDDRRRTDDGHLKSGKKREKRLETVVGMVLSQKMDQIVFTLDCRSAAIQSIKNKTALTISSRVSRDRRAGGSCKLAGAEEIGKVGRTVIGNYHPFHATILAKVVVGDLWEGRGRLWVQKDSAVGVL